MFDLHRNSSCGSLFSLFSSVSHMENAEKKMLKPKKQHIKYFPQGLNKVF